MVGVIPFIVAIFASFPLVIHTQCGRTRTRRSWHNLSSDDRSSYVTAFSQLHRSRLFPPLVDDHGNPDIVAHFEDGFLDTHRTFLIRIDEALERYGWNEGVVWYDSSRGGLFDDSEMWDMWGGMGEGCIASPFDTAVILDGDSGSRVCVTRAPSYETTIWPTSTVTAIMTHVSDVNEFGRAIDLGIHAQVHAAVGGSMARIPTSAGDPFFYMHHAYIDMIWSSWNAVHGGGGTDGMCYGYDELYDAVNGGEELAAQTLENQENEGNAWTQQQGGGGGGGEEGGEGGEQQVQALALQTENPETPEPAEQPEIRQEAIATGLSEDQVQNLGLTFEDLEWAESIARQSLQGLLSGSGWNQ